MAQTSRILRLERQKGPCLGTRGATVVGWVFQECYVCRKCVCNAHNALCNRHGVVQPPCPRDLRDEPVFDAFCTIADRACDDYMAHPMRSFTEWLEKWPVCKRLQILASLRAGEPFRPECCLAQVKRECCSNLPTKPRLIQYYFNLLTQARFGPHFYALQKSMTSLLRGYTIGCTDVTFASGMNSNEIAAWMDDVVARGATNFYERDGKCWDATMNRGHAAFRCAVYSRADPQLATFAASCVSVRCYANCKLGSLVYMLESTVKSGHNDTTLGNSIINAAIAVAVMMRLGLRASIIVAGDDLLIAIYPRSRFDARPINAATIANLEREYGIIPEARMFSRPQDVSFISGIFALVAGRHVFVPKPGKLLAKLFWTVSPPSHRTLAAYQRGVVAGLMPACGGIPVVRMFLRAFAGVGKATYNPRGFVYHKSNAIPAHADLDAWFSDRYAVSPRDVASCESFLAALPAERLVISHPLLTRIAQVDLASTEDREADDHDQFS